MFLAKLVRYVILLLVALSCLSYFGVETTGFAAVIGAAGLAIGLAFQGTLSNFAAGAMLLIFRPYKVGDAVNVAGYAGTVGEIELFTTAHRHGRQPPRDHPQQLDLRRGDREHHATTRAAGRGGRRHGVLGRHRRDARGAGAGRAQRATGGRATPAPEVVLVELGASSVNWSVRGWAQPRRSSATPSRP